MLLHVQVYSSHPSPPQEGQQSNKTTPPPPAGSHPEQVLTGEEEEGGGEQRNQHDPSLGHLEEGGREPVLDWAGVERGNGGKMDEGGEVGGESGKVRREGGSWNFDFSGGEKKRSWKKGRKGGAMVQNQNHCLLIVHYNLIRWWWASVPLIGSHYWSVLASACSRKSFLSLINAILLFLLAVNLM